MKKIVLALTSFVALSSASAKSPTGTGQIGSGGIVLKEADFAGSYLVGQVDIDGAFYVAQFEISPKGDVVVFRQANISEVSEDNDCIGNGIKIKGDILKIGVTCKNLGDGASLKFEINIGGLTLADLEKGATVLARSEATGEAWAPFKIVKRNKPYFN